MNEKDEQPECWSADEEYSYAYDTLDKAIAETLDYLYPNIPETLTMIGWRRMLAHADPDWVLEVVLENLDEELADPDGFDGTRPTQAMKEAAEAFCSVIMREYVPWACEEVCREVVNVKEWARENDTGLFQEIEKMEAVG